MTNAHYLIVSYFAFGFLSLGLGAAAYWVLRRPFAAIAETVAGRFRSSLLKRVLAVSMTSAAVLGFLSVSYTQQGCGKSYEQVVEDRGYMQQVNRQQLQGAGNWIAYTACAWGIIVVICLVVGRRKEEGPGDQRRSDQ
jgi:hypothetical protein